MIGMLGKIQQWHYMLRRMSMCVNKERRWQRRISCGRFFARCRRAGWGPHPRERETVLRRRRENGWGPRSGAAVLAAARSITSLPPSLFLIHTTQSRALSLTRTERERETRLVVPINGGALLLLTRRRPTSSSTSTSTALPFLHPLCPPPPPPPQPSAAPRHLSPTTTTTMVPLLRLLAATATRRP